MKRVNKFAVGIHIFLAIALVALIALALYPNVLRDGWTGELIASALMPTPVLGFIVYSAWQFRFDKRAGKPPKCRGCNLEKPFAITYETDGVCRECLDEALKLQGLGDNT